MTPLNGLKVVSAARKLIIEVPVSTRQATFPEGAVVSPYGQDNNAPSIVVQNATDGGSWQGASAPDGVVIMNEVPEPVALELLDMVAYCNRQPGGLNVGDLDVIVAKADSLGCRDVYTTKKDFVDSKLTPAGRMEGVYTGVVKRDDRDVCTVYRDADGVAQIVVKDEARRIEDDILQRTYRCADGSEIDLASIPTLS